ncbi:MAG: cobalamin-binding protein [Candidatus Binataceae bacterium]
MVATDCRIVSLLPSATEIVCALGLESELVGRSHECDYPPSVANLPALTSPKFNPDGSSPEIDRQVRSIVSQALSVYRVDVDRLKELRPDFIVTQSQCEVCAVSEEDVRRAVLELTGKRPEIISLTARDIAGIWSDIERTGAALGVADKAREVVDGLRARREAIRRRADAIGYRPGVVCIEWLDPLMIAGNWMPEMVDAAGGRDLLSAPGQHSPSIRFEDLAAAVPEVILVAPCGFPIKRSLAEMTTLLDHPGWPKLSAAQNQRVFIADGNQYFNRPGPRIADSLEILAEIIHPAAFHFGHEGAGWQRV